MCDFPRKLPEMKKLRFLPWNRDKNRKTLFENPVILESAEKSIFFYFNRRFFILMTNSGIGEMSRHSELPTCFVAVLDANKYGANLFEIGVTDVCFTR